jgi:uncharacterized membrane protein
MMTFIRTFLLSFFGGILAFIIGLVFLYHFLRFISS